MSYIILDRDGVINYESAEYIKSPEEWRPLPGSLEAIAQLNRCGYRVVVATNQSGVARGLYDIATLDAIHEKMQHALASVGGYIEKIYFCPHHPDEKCSCRKPNPGMLWQIAAEYPINLADTFFIGDSYCDVQAAMAAGAKPLLVKSGRGLRVLSDYPELAVESFADLNHAVSHILSQQK